MQATRMVQLLLSNEGVRMAAELHLEEFQGRRFKLAQLVEVLMSGGQPQPLRQSLLWRRVTRDTRTCVSSLHRVR